MYLSALCDVVVTCATSARQLQPFTIMRHLPFCFGKPCLILVFLLPLPFCAEKFVLTRFLLSISTAWSNTNPILSTRVDTIMASFPISAPSQAERQTLQQEVNTFVNSTGLSSADIRDALEYLRDRPQVEPIRNFTQERRARFQQLSDFRDEVRSQKNDAGWNFTALQLHFLLNCAVVSSTTIQEVLQDKSKGTSARIDWLDHIADIVTLSKISIEVYLTLANRL